MFVTKTWVENITKHSGVKCQEADKPWSDRTDQYASKEECIK